MSPACMNRGGVRAIPTVIVVQVLSFSLIVAGNIVFPVLGPGIGFLAFVAALHRDPG